MNDIIQPTAYARLSPDARQIVDLWLEHGNKRLVAKELGWGRNGNRVQRYIDNPLVQEALLERQHLYQPLPQRIATVNEVLERLTDLMRNGENETIQFKAAQELAKRFMPHEVNVNVKTDFNERKKSLFDELEKLTLDQPQEIHR